MSYYELMYVYWKDASLCHSQSFIRLAFETLLFTTSCFDCWRLFELDCHFWMLFVCFLVLYAFPSRLLESSFGCHEKERSSSHLIGWERWSIGKPLRIAMYPPHKCTHTHWNTHSCTPCFHCPWFIWILKMSRSSQQSPFLSFFSFSNSASGFVSSDGSSDSAYEVQWSVKWGVFKLESLRENKLFLWVVYLR